MYPSASCCLAGVGRERTIFVSEGRLASSSVCVSWGLVMVTAIPKGSCEVWKDTGVNSGGVEGVELARAIQWEEPQAILLMRSWRPDTRCGFLFTVTVPLPSWPCSLSPQAYTWGGVGYVHVCEDGWYEDEYSQHSEQKG